MPDPTRKALRDLRLAERVTIRMARAERQALEQVARASGQKPSTFVRGVVAGAIQRRLTRTSLTLPAA